MQKFFSPERENWEKLSARPSIKSEDLGELVKQIFTSIQKNGDKAIFEYNQRFDKCKSSQFIIKKKTIDDAYESCNPLLLDQIRIAIRNVRLFHNSQKQSKQVIETSKGVLCWQETRAIESIGIYIPGGSAPLFSTVIMLAVPAMLAGCKEIVLCSPPSENGEINPIILATAKEIGITQIVAVGGIQAIAGLSYGTESIPKVNKIFGPGNQYVTAAKLFAQSVGVAIDMPAGPSEVLVIADANSNASFVAADLLAQAEHGEDSQVILLTTSRNKLLEVANEIELQLQCLPRLVTAKKALHNSKLIFLETIEVCMEFSNVYAPEHLILNVENAESWVPMIVNAGSVFIGEYSCESAGDYASGTNHTLPTKGTCKAYSGVSLTSFTKNITFQNISKQGITGLGNTIEVMAEAEGLFAHKNAVTIRLKNIENENN